MLLRTYRPFIDGLRAVAILTVVGSHLDLPGFTGAYIGVDIFFVISGYLIIGQIVEDIKKERFHLFDFFARRAFRILPAFLFVMVCCGFLATVVFVQPETKEFATTFLYTAVMLANHYLLAHQGYFDMAAFTKPLLHMWSLAVEQFYIRDGRRSDAQWRFANSAHRSAAGISLVCSLLRYAIHPSARGFLHYRTGKGGRQKKADSGCSAASR